MERFSNLPRFTQLAELIREAMTRGRIRIRIQATWRHSPALDHHGVPLGGAN